MTDARKVKRELRLQMLEDEVRLTGRILPGEVEEVIGVSESTARDYMQELEEEYEEFSYEKTDRPGRPLGLVYYEDKDENRG